MNILHLTTAFKRNKNDIITPWLVDLLYKQGEKNNIFVLTSGYRKINKQQKYKNIKVFRFNYAPSNIQKMTHDFTIGDFLKKHTIYYLLLPVFFFTGFLYLYKIVKKEKIDIINIHWPFPMALIAIPVKVLLKTKLVYVWYGADIKLFKAKFSKYKGFLKIIIKYADYHVPISNFTKNEVDEIIKLKNVKVIPYGIRIPQKMNYKKENIILFVGRFVDRKGIKYLIKAMDYVNKDYKLYIVGSGPLERKLKEKTENNNRINFTGRINDEELKELYKKAKIFVLPAIFDKNNDTEGLGVVLIEAIGYSVVCIATGIGGITDIIIDKETGLFSEEKNPMDIAKKINTLIENKNLYNKLKENAYKHIKENFSLVSVNKKFDEVYSEIIE